jgi:hypothetical protein
MANTAYNGEKSPVCGVAEEVHYWRPPCSCGVELGTAIQAEQAPKPIAKGDVHFWRPPCSCGVSLDDVFE